ncbi:hypothetical protein SAMN02745221_01181 [Thermosyntropha lipolytica DSM 11003]|uniref:Uncharacterized protein n=1 Tax=Thermosyntropha lipolytica DSM 11003 TaxID=1123382 RepID=A0A1M5NEG2_9FIRM|nr:hypothetical protein [Thermosyntropha lipolytica]SHG87847.1 hypothetical protein SAMN02745221_01181 [Thermosyntropha lipolytica DSM 11003]
MVFGAGAAHAGSGGIFSHPVVAILVVILSIIIFVKFCGWAKNFSLSKGVKKAVYILTGVGLIVFNYLYSMGNKAYAEGDLSRATLALVVSLVWVFIFAFVLMAETKAE